MEEFNFKLESSLKNIAVISIVEALWKSSEVINKINKLSTGKKSETIEIKKRQFKPPAYINDHDNYCRWEKIIDVVTEMVNLLPLPTKVKSNLQKFVTLMGEKIYYFYNQYQVDKAGVVSLEFNHNTVCHYSFSNHGIMWFNCPSVHLSFNLFSGVLPYHKLVKILPQQTYPPTFNYFATKLCSSLDQLHISNKMKDVMRLELLNNINSRLHFDPAPDFKAVKFLFILNLLAPDKKCEFIQENLNDLLMCFLPVWPFQELVPQLLDLCVKKNFKMDHRRLLKLLLFCIEMDNETRYQFRKQFYMDMFEKVWLNTSNGKRFWILAYIISNLLRAKKNMDILKIVFTTEVLGNCFNCVNMEDIMDRDRPIWHKCYEMVYNNTFEFEFVKTLIDGLVPLEPKGDELVHGKKEFVFSYLYFKRYEITK